jgi:hypothetical protein
MAIETVLIDVRRGVHIRTRFHEGASGFQVAVFRGDVEQGDALKRGECRNERRPVPEDGRLVLDCGFDGRPVVPQHGRQPRVRKLGPALEEQAQTVAKSIGSRVFLKQPMDRQLSANGRTRICSRIQCLTNAFDIMSVESGQEFSGCVGHRIRPPRSLSE